MDGIWVGVLIWLDLRLECRGLSHCVRAEILADLEMICKSFSEMLSIGSESGCLALGRRHFVSGVASQRHNTGRGKSSAYRL